MTQHRLVKSFSKYGIYLIVLLGFALRVIFAARGVGAPIIRDEDAYYSRALLVVQQGFAEQEMFRAPAWPYLLALAIREFGKGRQAAGFVGSLIDTANIALLYVLTQALFKRKNAALLGAFLFATYLEFIAFARSLYSETLFIFWASLGFYLVIKNWRTRAVWQFVVAGIALALAALTRDFLAYFAMIVIPVWLLIARYPQLRRAVAQVGLIWVGLALVFIPWALRNWNIEHRLVLTSTSAEWTLLRYNIVAERAMAGNKAAASDSSDDASDTTSPINKQTDKELAQQAPSARSGYVLRRIAGIVLTNPLLWLGFKSKDLMPLWNPSLLKLQYFRLDDLDPRVRALLDPIVIGYFMVLVVMAVWGFFVAPDDAPKLLLALFVFYSLFGFIATHFQQRFRISLMFALIPYMAFGIISVVIGLRAQLPRAWFYLKRPRLYAAALTSLLMVVMMWSRVR
jgi:4-amino-4-deoxy-L-arabinose transferase-like glycosyltransferase